MKQNPSHPFVRHAIRIAVVAVLLAQGDASASIIAGLPLRRVARVSITGSPQSTITFGSLASTVPAGTKHLLVELSGAQTFGDRRFCEVRFNGDSSAIYDRREFSATGTAVTTDTFLNQNLGQGVDIPPAAPGVFGGGYIFIPYAFRTDNLKIWQAMGSSVEERFQRHVGVWKSTAALNSITLRPWQNVSGVNQWAVGTIANLYVVEESLLVQETVLSGSGTFTFGSLPATANHLAFVGALRSPNIDQYKGDRIYHTLNGDTNAANYKIQRFGGEDIANNTVLNQTYTEPRIGWTSGGDAPAGAYGSLVAFYPEYRNTTFFQPWFSQHAALESRYFPVSQENGRWASNGPVTSIRFSAQVAGNYLAGSRIGAYRTNTASGVRQVVGSGGAASVTLSVPSGVVGLRLIVVARTNANADEDRLKIEINGDTSAANYAMRRASARAGTHETAQFAGNECGAIPGSLAPANVFGCGVVTIGLSQATDRQKHILSSMGAAGGRLALYGGRWKNDDPVVSITLRPTSGANFLAGSTFELSFAADNL